MRKWQRDLHDHVVVCGFGIKGRSSLEFIQSHNEKIDAVVIDEDDAALEEANRLNLNGICGKSYDRQILEAARVKTARFVIVALSSDEQAILTVLRVRELNDHAKIVTSCKEESNVELLYSSGASEVIVSSSSAGRILGMAAETPEAARVVNDLLTFGDGLDINERFVDAHGEPIERDGSETAIAVIRDGNVHRPGDEECRILKRGDQVIYIDQTQGGDPEENESETPV
jgi:voltage-gated potassium channel